MSIIHVNKLSKHYRVSEKQPGILGAVKGLFVRKHYDIKAVEKVSFEIGEGELVGFIGPNGAGKTTTLKCLTGLLYPTSGKVSVLGFNPFDRKKEFLKQIAFVMGQKTQLWWDLPAMETFLLNKEIYQIPDEQFQSTLSDLIKLLQIEDVVNIQVRNLSLGQRMKCELVAALLHKPKILFLDEPTIGLDVVMQKNLRDFIRQYNQKYKATVILTSHYMQDVKQLCKRVIVINHGKILFDGKLDSISKAFGKTKELSLAFSKPVKKEELEKLGEVKMIEDQSAIISVPTTKSNQVASLLLQKFPIKDINIQEPDIEEIIRKVFSQK